MSVLSALSREAGQKLSKEASQKAGREVASKVGREVSSKASREVSSKVGREVSSKVGREVSSKASREVSSKVGREVSTKAGREASAAAGKVLGRDVLVTAGEATVKTGGKKAVAEAANPAFDEAMKLVRAKISKEGQYTNVSTLLLEALGQVKSTEEALNVTSLARKLSVSFNPANKGALKASLETAAAKAGVHDEAYKTLVQVVRTRQEAYALFSVAEKNKLVEAAVERYVAIGGEELEALATKAVKLMPARFDQRSAKATIKAVTVETTNADRARVIANFLNKALN